MFLGIIRFKRILLAYTLFLTPKLILKIAKTYQPTPPKEHKEQN